MKFFFASYIIDILTEVISYDFNKSTLCIKSMIDLAEHQDAGYIPLKDIAARQEISEKYLEIIIKILVKGKMLKGLRGKGGGYILTREPSEYIVGDIIELTEGPLAPVACLQPDAEVCNRKDICITLPLWEKYYTLVHDFFFHITLEDVINNNF